MKEERGGKVSWENPFGVRNVMSCLSQFFEARLLAAGGKVSCKRHKPSVHSVRSSFSRVVACAFEASVGLRRAVDVLRLRSQHYLRAVRHQPRLGAVPPSHWLVPRFHRAVAPRLQVRSCRVRRYGVSSFSATPSAGNAYLAHRA